MSAPLRKRLDWLRRREMTRCAKSCRKQMQQTGALFDQLVGELLEMGRHVEAERLSRLYVDD
jgi:hypothetical protein